MSTVLSSRELCNRVLRKIGAFPITESAADGELVQETLYWLDLALAELPGTARRFWMVSDTVSFPLTSGVQSYDLKEKLGDSWPEEGLEHVVEAWLQNSTGSRLPLEIVRRHDFEAQSKPAASGTPCIVYIDRVAEPTLQVYPVQATDDWSVYLILQKLGPNVAMTTPTPGGERLEARLDIPAAWQRWAIFQVSADVGDGPIRKLASSTINEWRGVSRATMAELEAFQNQQHETTPPITASMDIC